MMSRRLFIASLFIIPLGLLLGLAVFRLESVPPAASEASGPGLLAPEPGALQPTTANNAAAPPLAATVAPVNAVPEAPQEESVEIIGTEQAPNAPSMNMGALLARLEQEKSARLQLQQQVAQLQSALQGVQQQLAQLTPEPAADAAKQEQAAASARRIDTPTLMAAGFSASDAEYFTQRWGEQEMAGLYLRDQAIREGWLDTPRYAEAARELNAGNQSLRQEVGDAAYDQLLFASGHPNRIVVAAVIDSSPAQTAGLQAGDRIISYAGNRIYSGNELRTTTSAGTVDEIVPVQVERGGQIIEFSLPRGPLGVRMDAESVAP